MTAITFDIDIFYAYLSFIKDWSWQELLFDKMINKNDNKLKEIWAFYISRFCKIEEYIYTYIYTYIYYLFFIPIEPPFWIAPTSKEFHYFPKPIIPFAS